MHLVASLNDKFSASSIRLWLDDAIIGSMSAFIIDELRNTLSLYREEQAALLFAAGLDSGQIEFRLRGWRRGTGGTGLERLANRI